MPCGVAVEVIKICVLKVKVSVGGVAGKQAVGGWKGREARCRKAQRGGGGRGGRRQSISAKQQKQASDNFLAV